MLWVLVALCILLTHSVIPHKEYRFVFPAFACLIVVAAMASADLVQSLRGRQWRWAGTIVAAGTWVAVSAALAFAPRFQFQWFKSRDLIEAEFLLAKQPNLCGILLYDYTWAETGGYAYLHRDVPFYELRERSRTNVSRVVSAFNAVVLRRSSAADFPKEFTLRNCITDDVCVMMRDGSCTRILQFPPCTAAPAIKPDPSRSDPCLRG
jgi:GPI mannosyltransferase 3